MSEFIGNRAIISVHNHNDLGLAVANTLASIKAGARQVECTINGLGERAGNAALEEVLMALIYVYGYKADVNTKMFREVSEYVSQASGRELPIWKAIVGDNMFAHESGIHADGAIKNPKNYEAFDPDVVGLQRQIVIGKHSGKAGIINKFKEFITFTGARVSTLLLDMVIMFLFVTILKGNDKIFKLVSQILVIVGNYLLSKLIVFKKDSYEKVCIIDTVINNVVRSMAV